MKIYKQSFKLLKYNLSSVILFEVIYKLITTAILTPVMYWMFNMSLTLAEVDYLNTESLKTYMLSPATYAFFFLLIMIFSAYAMVQASGLIYAMESSYKEEKTNAVVILLKGVFNSMRVIRPRNMMFVFYILLTVPFTYTITISGSLLGISIPDYLYDFLLSHKIIFVPILILYVVLCIFGIGRIFALNVFTVDKRHYRQSVVESKRLIKRNRIRFLLGVLSLNAIITLLLFGNEWLLMSGVRHIIRYNSSYKNFKFVFQSAVQLSYLGVYILFSIIATPIIYSYICAYYYTLLDKSMCAGVDDGKHHRIDDTGERELAHKKRSKFITVIAIVASIALNSLYIYLDMNNKYNLSMWYRAKPDITAHRGDSKHAPENTLAAIKLAVDNEADIVEIDIRQTKDGELILMHDESLKRTAGVNKKVGELTLKELKEIDIGSFFSEEYSGERIPTLDEVLTYAVEEEVFLNIEIKTASKDTDIVEKLVEKLEEYEFVDNCVVASSNYNVIKKLDAINDDIETVLIMYMALGSIDALEGVDIYSVRHNFITADMVKSAHKNGIKIYAWTVNNEKRIREMLLMGVDSIITDNPYKTKEIVYASRSTFLTLLMQKLLDEY